MKTLNFVITLITALIVCSCAEPIQNTTMDSVNDTPIYQNNLREVSEKFILTDTIKFDSLKTVSNTDSIKIDSTFMFIYKQKLSEYIIVTGKQSVDKQTYDKLKISDVYAEGECVLLSTSCNNSTFSLSNNEPFMVIDKFFRGCGGYSGNMCDVYYYSDDHYCPDITKFFVIVSWYEPATEKMIERVLVCDGKHYNNIVVNKTYNKIVLL